MFLGSAGSCPGGIGKGEGGHQGSAGAAAVWQGEPSTKTLFWVLVISLLWVLIARECGWVGLMRVRVLAECSQENGGGPASDLDTSVVSGRSAASRNSVARLGGSLVHSSSTTGVRDLFCAPCLFFYSDTLPNLFSNLDEGGAPICSPDSFEEHTNMSK